MGTAIVQKTGSKIEGNFTYPDFFFNSFDNLEIVNSDLYLYNIFPKDFYLE